MIERFRWLRWRYKYAKIMKRKINCTFKQALTFTDAGREGYEEGEDPITAVKIELSYWND